MKSYLLVLLLAIPPMVCNLLATEKSDAPEAVPAQAACTPGDGCTAKPAQPATTANAPAGQNAAPAAKPAPATRSLPTQAKPWFM